MTEPRKTLGAVIRDLEAQIAEAEAELARRRREAQTADSEKPSTADIFGDFIEDHFNRSADDLTREFAETDNNDNEGDN